MNYTQFLSDVNGSRLVQLNDCTCIGYTQTFECSVIGMGITLWNGTFFVCSENEIRLRHSQYNIDSGTNGECNQGAVMANSVGSLNNCHTSRLIVTIEEAMINETVECSYDNLSAKKTVLIGQKSLMATETPYPPPNNVRVQANNSQQITFVWDEVTSQCSSLQYIITAINCGVCPNTTADINITCHIQSDISLHTCMFAVQTEICGYLRGEKSEHIIVHIDGERYL